MTKQKLMVLPIGMPYPESGDSSEVHLKAHKDITLFSFPGNLKTQPALVEPIVVIGYVLARISDRNLVGDHAVFRLQVSIIIDNQVSDRAQYPQLHLPVRRYNKQPAVLCYIKGSIFDDLGRIHVQ